MNPEEFQEMNICSCNCNRRCSCDRCSNEENTCCKPCTCHCCRCMGPTGPTGPTGPAGVKSGLKNI